MKKITLLICVLIMFSLILAACNLPNKNATPTADSNFVFTAAALTVQAKINENTPIPPLPSVMPPIETTNAPIATNTPAVSTSQPTKILSPTPTSLPCDDAKFISDVSIPDDTVFTPGTTFTKTWRLKNTGSCTWTSGYAIVFENGAAMEGPATKSLPGNVAPGETVDISVDFKAPSSPDTYKGNWKLRNSSGVVFGLGDDDKPFWVQIKVAAPTTQPFAVTNATFSINPPAYTGVCPFPITLVGKIKVSAPGVVTYTYRREDGFVSDKMTKTFDEAGEKNLVDYTMPMGTGPGFTWSGKIWIYIDSPNHQNFNDTQFTITCNP
jgi:hypothetical protein